MSDDELAGAASVGDSEAFGILVTRMSPGLLRYLRRMVSDPQLAEDLAQETLLAAWKGLPDFEFRSSFRTWMFGIAHRKTVDHRRRRHEVPTDDEQFVDLAATEPLPADEVERLTLIEALRAELPNLPATSRAAWWLREVEGLSTTEIAKVLQLSNGSVRGHLQRSRKFLSTRLAPWKPPRGSPGTINHANTDDPKGGHDEQ
ncbi:sigma-70 family RNA polymerase sigma factor [Gordonia sp. NPDC003585]|uniref:RNA polymerase sigma factor n=1 Tax=Gordonia sp. NPDC003585 TaxID=3154275 RepID=UPI0033A309B4